MNPIKKNLEQIWDQLRGQKPNRAENLDKIEIRNLRGIAELNVPLSYPVSVLAGANGCGKSTVLFALATAYNVGRYDLTPARLFPAFSPSSGEEHLRDTRFETELTFTYIHLGATMQMRWKRNKEKWSKSFFGRPKAMQPERQVYLRTLANLSNPSEVRSVLQLAYKQYDSIVIDASDIAFAHAILPYRYTALNKISSGVRDLLFAQRSAESDGTIPSYSEFNMSAGERSILRLSMAVSKMSEALVLIDEVETGLHPYLQQMLMLELQRLALRNKLQIVVTSHSPTILETVPPEGRLFLERSNRNVVRRDAYRDLIQKALYGRSQNTLSFLCEDEESENFIRGILDYLGPELDFLQNDIDVGRDTGKDQFSNHLDTLGKFRKLNDMVFVLDGDGREIGPELEAKATQMGQIAQIVFLPGNDVPEEWAWKTISQHPEDYTELFNMTGEIILEKLGRLTALYANAADKPQAIAKNRFFSFATELAKTPPQIMRILAKKETSAKRGEVYELANKIREFISTWRSA